MEKLEELFFTGNSEVFFQTAVVPFATFYDCRDALPNFWKLPWCPKFLQKVKAKLPCPLKAEVSGLLTPGWRGANKLSVLLRDTSVSTGNWTTTLLNRNIRAWVQCSYKLSQPGHQRAKSSKLNVRPKRKTLQGLGTYIGMQTVKDWQSLSNVWFLDEMAVLMKWQYIKHFGIVLCCIVSKQSMTIKLTFAIVHHFFFKVCADVFKSLRC